jgi:hypothetical protein
VTKKEQYEKIGGLNSRQFFHIMGNTHQPPLSLYLFKASQMKSAEAHILFDNAEYGLHLSGTVRTQTLPRLAGEIGSGLSAIFQ